MQKLQPNILFIICHDLGRHLGCYGAGVSTPNLDQLAGEGVRFENCYCSAAQCSPSRGSILTGKSPHSNGLMGLAHIGWEIDEHEKKLPQYLHEIGYETHLFGVQHESAVPETLGYDVVHKCSLKAKEAANAADEWLRARASKQNQTPFFISLGFSEPHRPYPHDASEYPVDKPEEVRLLNYLPDHPGIRGERSFHGDLA